MLLLLLLPPLLLLLLLLLLMSKLLPWYPRKVCVCGLSMTSAPEMADCCHLVDCCLFCVKICTAQLAVQPTWTL